MGDRMMGERTGLLTRFQRRINAVGRPAVLAALAVAAVFAAIALLGVTRATDPDIHWHLAAGRLIRSTGSVPAADPFSYTAYGLPWVDSQWLFQVGASLLFDAGGFPALTLATAVLITGLFAFLWHRVRRILGVPAASGGETRTLPADRAASLSAAVVLLAALASHGRFLARPEVLSWWFLALVLAGLDAAAVSGAARRRLILWGALPLIALVWVNVQSLFILGPALTALALVAALARALRPGAAAAGGATADDAAAGRAESLTEAADLFASLALQAMAALINPHGARAIRLPFDHLLDPLGGGTLLAGIIGELRPSLSADLLAPSIIAFWLLAAATVFGLAANPRRTLPFDLMVAGATFYMALRAQRDIPIFAIAVAPIVLRGARAMLAAAALDPPPRARLIVPAALAVAALTLAAAVVGNRLYRVAPAERWFGVGPIPYYLPDEAADFVAGAALPGQVFHPLETGGFLVRAWSGDRRVFIDGRNDPYMHGVLETYVRALADPAAFEATARKYQIMAVLWPHQRVGEGRTLLKWLAGGHGWVLVHLDPGAAVYARQEVLTPGTPAAEALPGTMTPDALHAYLRQRLAAAPFDGPPIREAALAEFFAVTGDTAGAALFLRQANPR